MQRKAVRLIGLVLAGAAAFSIIRRLFRRFDDDDAPPEPPTLVPVPDLVPEAEVVPEPEPEPEAAPEPEPVATAAPASEPEAEPTAVDGQRWVPPVDEDCPPGYPVKVNERSGIYHVPGGLSYERTRPTRCYPDEAAAEADGFRRAKR
ncbi:MAG: hypothetical protein AAFO29_02285 [Actinomycetota bacterium]